MRPIGGILAATAAVTVLHFLLPAREEWHGWHLLLVAAWFLPLLQAARLGLPATLAVLAALTGALAFHAEWSWRGHRVLQTGLLAQIGTFWLVGMAAALFFRRLRSQERRSDRLERELLLARNIQESLQPRAPLVDQRFELAGRSEPAHEVGGDLVDYFPLEDGRLAFFIGDVSGKGLAAAFHAVMVRRLVRRYARRGMPPGRCLSLLNSFLLHDGDGSVFVSAFLGYLDPATGEVVGCCAGHEPPVRLGPSGPRILAVPPNMVVGAAPGTFRQVRFRLGREEGLVLYTDGITETRSDRGTHFGLRRLRQAVAGIRSGSAGAVVERLMESATRYGARRDDRTVLVVLGRESARPGPEPFAPRLALAPGAGRG